MTINELIDEGYRYMNGTGVEKDDKKALEYFNQAKKIVENKHDKCMILVGMAYVYWKSHDPEIKNVITAERCFREVVNEVPLPEIYYDLGMIYRAGEGGIRVRPTDAAECFRKALETAQEFDCKERSYLNMLLQMANCYKNGFGVTRDMREAARLYQKGTDLGSCQACYQLGLLYKKGEGVEKNEKKAEELYRKAIEGNVNVAKYNLAWLQVHAEDPNVKNIPEAVQTFEEMLTEGDKNGSAAAQLGWIYEKGAGGYPVDRGKALAYFQQAAEKGSSMAHYWIATYIMNGTGIEQDLEKAEKLFREKGYYSDGRIAAQRLFDSLDEPAKKKMFIERYKKREMINSAYMLEQLSALDADAGFMAGAMCELGIGVEADMGKAVRFYEKSAAMGSQEAKCTLRRINDNAQNRKLYCPCCGKMMSATGTAYSCDNCGISFSEGFTADTAAIDRLNAANRKRHAGDHEKALTIMKELNRQYPDEPMLLWCELLARYGVRYQVRALIMEIDRISAVSILHDPAIQRILRLTHGVEKRIYVALAKRLNTERRVQMDIIEKSHNFGGCDVILCYSKRDKAAEKTAKIIKSERSLYYTLPDDLEPGKYAYDRETVLYNALNNATSLVVLGSKKKYLDDRAVSEIYHRYWNWVPLRKQHHTTCISLGSDPDIFNGWDADCKLEKTFDPIWLGEELWKRSKNNDVEIRNMLYAIREDAHPSVVDFAFNAARQKFGLPALTDLKNPGIIQFKLEAEIRGRLYSRQIIDNSRHDIFKFTIRFPDRKPINGDMKITWEIHDAADNLAVRMVSDYNDCKNFVKFSQSWYTHYPDTGEAVLAPGFYYMTATAEGQAPVRQRFAIIDSAQQRLWEFAKTVSGELLAAPKNLPQKERDCRIIESAGRELQARSLLANCLSGRVSVGIEVEPDGIIRTGKRRSHMAVLRRNGTVKSFDLENTHSARLHTGSWKNIKMITCISTGTVGLKNDGTLVYAGTDRALERYLRALRNIVRIWTESACLNLTDTSEKTISIFSSGNKKVKLEVREIETENDWQTASDNISSNYYTDTYKKYHMRGDPKFSRVNCKTGAVQSWRSGNIFPDVGLAVSKDGEILAPDGYVDEINGPYLALIDLGTNTYCLDFEEKLSRLDGTTDEVCQLLQPFISELIEAFWASIG